MLLKEFINFNCTIDLILIFGYLDQRAILHSFPHQAALKLFSMPSTQTVHLFYSLHLASSTNQSNAK